MILPKLGRLRTHEDTTRLSEHLDSGTARITKATLAFERERWFVSFGVRMTVADAAPVPDRRNSRAVGITLGAEHLLVIADADGHEVERVPTPQHLGKAQQALRGLVRKAERQVGPHHPVTYRRREPSRGWSSTQARIRRVRARVANLQEDALHQATTRIVREHNIVAIFESGPDAVAGSPATDSGRLKGTTPSKSFSELTRMLEYKTTWAQSILVRGPERYSYSATCSRCGAIETKLPRSERTYECTTCNSRIPWDSNTAVNLARLARVQAGVPGFDASGATQKTNAMLAASDEAGTSDLCWSATPQEVAT